jgi:hypothetical protein
VFRNDLHAVRRHSARNPLVAALDAAVRPDRILEDPFYDFENILAEKFCEKMAFLLKTKLNYAKIGS